MNVLLTADGGATYPTWLPGALPSGEDDKWHGNLEAAHSADWARTAWDQNGIVALRAGNHADKEAKQIADELMKLVLQKAWVSAQAGRSIVVWGERPPLKPDAPPISFKAPSSTFGATITSRHLLSIPANRVPTDAGRDWSVDAEGSTIASSFEGTGAGCARELNSGGWNVYPIQVWLYEPTGQRTADLTTTQLETLARTLANCAKPMSTTAQEVPATWHSPNGDIVELTLRTFPPEVALQHLARWVKQPIKGIRADRRRGGKGNDMPIFPNEGGLRSRSANHCSERGGRPHGRCVPHF